MTPAEIRAAVAAELRKADLVARLTDAELERIAQLVVDRLEERLFPALAEPSADTRPKLRSRRRAKHYFRSSGS